MLIIFHQRGARYAVGLSAHIAVRLWLLAAVRVAARSRLTCVRVCVCVCSVDAFGNWQELIQFVCGGHFHEYSLVNKVYVNRVHTSSLEEVSHNAALRRTADKHNCKTCRRRDTEFSLKFCTAFSA